MTTGFRPAAWLPQATAQHSLGVVLSRLELLTPTLSVWCSNQLSYRTVMELCVARNLVLHLLYSFINKGVAKEECGNPGPACLLQYLTCLPDSPAVSGGMEPFPNFRCRSLYILMYIVFIRRSRKEVFQPHLPVRLPCYDLAPITSFALGRPLR